MNFREVNVSSCVIRVDHWHLEAGKKSEVYSLIGGVRNPAGMPHNGAVN